MGLVTILRAAVPGLYRGKVNTLQRSERALRLEKAAREPDYRWSVDKERDPSVADFLSRQRIMGRLIIKG